MTADREALERAKPGWRIQQALAEYLETSMGEVRASIMAMDLTNHIGTHIDALVEQARQDEREACEAYLRQAAQKRRITADAHSMTGDKEGTLRHRASTDVLIAAAAAIRARRKP